MQAKPVMDACNCPKSMSFLDEIFGTDGRKHKDEGIWNWVKNQRMKRKLKKAAAAEQKQQYLVSASFLNDGSYSPTSTATASSGYYPHNRYHPESTHIRSPSVSSATTNTSHLSFYCSPRSPTSTFTPSYSSTASTAYSSSSSPRDSLFIRRPASIQSSTSTAYSTPMAIIDSSPKTNTHQFPFTHSRQRARSTFTLPPAKIVESSLVRRNTSSRQYTSQPFDDYGEEPIRRSTSSRSAPTHFYPHSSHYQYHSQEQEDENDAESFSLSTSHNSNSSSSTNRSNSSSSAKGKGVQQRDYQEGAMDEITETNEDSVYMEGYILDSSLYPSSARRRRSVSTYSLHHHKEDGWWWE